MLNEQEKRDLKQTVDEAWLTFHNYQYEKIEPRFYKEKKGRRMELLNPWKDMKERIAAEKASFELYQKYHKLAMKYYEETGERAELPPRLWKKQETPSGDRWVKV